MRSKIILACAAIAVLAGLAFLSGQPDRTSERHARLEEQGEIGSTHPTGPDRSSDTSPTMETRNETSFDAKSIRLADVLAVFEIPAGTADQVDRYLDFEAKADFDGTAALTAFRIQDGCTRIPPADSMTREMNLAPGIAEAREVCQRILDAANLTRQELIERAADLKVPEAILLKPSFPPPFSIYGRGRAEERFAQWQAETVDQLEELSSRGSIDAKLRLARIFAGEFPDFRDHGLAYLYVEEILRSPGLTPFQEASAASLRSRLPKPEIGEE